MILLDTDVLVDITRELPAAVGWLASLGDEPVAIPGFVAMELLQGCRVKAELEATRDDLKAYAILWPSPADCDAAMSSFAAMHLSHGLGLLDALIAHTAMGAKLSLHTFNTRHLGAIPGLTTVQPYTR